MSNSSDYRSDKTRLDPIRAREIDRLLAVGDRDDLWGQLYRLQCRLESAEKRASERERFLEQNEKLKARLFDLMHIDSNSIVKLDCCGGVEGVSTVTSGEVRLHEAACPLRSLTHEEVQALRDLYTALVRGDGDGVTTEQIQALQRCFGTNNVALRRAAGTGR